MNVLVRGLSRTTGNPRADAPGDVVGAGVTRR